MVITALRASNSCGSELTRWHRGVVAKKTLVGVLALERVVTRETVCPLVLSRRSGSQVVEIVTGSNNENAAVYFLKGATSEKSPRAVVDQLAPQSTDFSLSLLSTFIGERPVLLVLFFPLAAARHHTKPST
jgi:hypothetical protein